MGEIRLTCPECGTEYRLSGDKIPKAGRNVECSACGHVWHQTKTGEKPAPEPVKAAPVAPPLPKPKLNRPLPDAVLSVLQEEAALSRQPRGTPPPAAPKAAAPKPAAKTPDAPEWPATTVTDSNSVGASATLSLGSERAPAGPALSRHINTSPQRAPEKAPDQGEMAETVNRTTPQRPVKDEINQTATPPRRSYRAGFLWPVGIAVALLLLYVAAPRLADQGAVGASLMEYRITVDDGRHWLQQTIFGASE